MALILLLDIGNTRIKWAILQDGVLDQRGEAERPKGRFDAFAKGVWSDVAKPERILVSNVAGKAFADRLSQWAQRRWKLRPEFVQPCAEAHGVVNSYARPECLGVDRWAALIAVRSKTRDNACIVDCGTAITIDVLTAAGQHEGGLIVPGIAMMRTALTEKTAGLLVDDVEDRDMLARTLLARDTHAAIVGGTLYAAVAVIDRVVNDVTAEIQGATRLYITGGDAPQLMTLLKRSYVHEPDLVLQGLAAMA